MNLFKTNHLETERLILRELNPEVYQQFFSTCSDEEIATFLNLKTDEDLATEKEKFKKGFTTWRISFCNFQMIEKASNEIIGAIGFHMWYLQHARAEIGYAITDESKKRMGFMAEAFQPVITYGFEVMKLNRIEAFASLNNIPSVKLLENNGFIYEGLLREHYFRNNIVEDSAIFGLLKKDFYQKPTS